MAISAGFGPGLRGFSVCRVLGDCALVKIASFDQVSEAKSHMETLGSQDSHAYIVFSEHNRRVRARLAKPRKKSDEEKRGRKARKKSEEEKRGRKARKKSEEEKRVHFESRYKRKRPVENHLDVSPTLILHEHVARIRALKEYFLLMQECYAQSKTVRERRDILAVCIDIVATASRIREESDALRNFYQQAMARHFGTQP